MNAANNEFPFDSDRLDAISEMLVRQVEHDSARRIRPHRLAFLVSLIVAAVLVSTGGTALALTGHLPFVDPPAPPVVTETVTPTPTETPTPTPTPTPPPAQTLNGFDIASVYAACEAAVPASNWPSGPRPSPAPQYNTFGLAGTDDYVSDHTSGDPDAIYVNVVYQWDDNHYSSDLCVASGDPADPKVEYIRSLD